MPQVAKSMGYRRLIGEAPGSCASHNDKKVGNYAKKSETKDNRCDGGIDLPQIARECTAEEQQNDL